MVVERPVEQAELHVYLARAELQPALMVDVPLRVLRHELRVVVAEERLVHLVLVELVQVFLRVSAAASQAYLDKESRHLQVVEDVRSELRLAIPAFLLLTRY